MRPLRTEAQWAADSQREQTDPAKRMRDAYLPEHWRELTWDDYADAVGTRDESLKDVLRWWADHWKPGDPEGLVLLGPPGYGKTFGAVLAAKQVCLAGAWVKYVTHAQLGIRQRALIGLEEQAKSTDDWGDYNRARYRLMFIETECDLLVLDDVGKDYRSDNRWTDTQLDSLLRRRVELGKATILTSNVPHDEWIKFDPSMSSFMYELGEIVNITRGRDMRKRRSKIQESRRAGR